MSSACDNAFLQPAIATGCISLSAVLPGCIQADPRDRHLGQGREPGLFNKSSNTKAVHEVLSITMVLFLFCEGDGVFQLEHTSI